MIGGPWLGVIAFLIVAVALGWGLTKLFQGMLEHTTQTLDTQELDHGFDLGGVYLTQKDLLIGRRSYGDLVVAPGAEDLPPGTPGKHHWPTTTEYRAAADPARDYPDLDGLIERRTPVQFVEVIEDADNAQTRVLVRLVVMDGPFAAEKPVLGMHLESADTNPETGEKRYQPRGDLFELLQPGQPPLESPTRTP